MVVDTQVRLVLSDMVSQELYYRQMQISDQFIKEGWILNKRSKNEGKKEVRLKSSKTCSTVLKEIISAIATGSVETKYYVKGMFLYSFGVIFFYGIY